MWVLLDVRLSNHRVLTNKQGQKGYFYTGVNALGGPKSFVAVQLWEFTPYDQLFLP